MIFQRSTDAKLAIWNDETVLYHQDSGDTYLFQGDGYTQLLKFCVARDRFDESELHAVLSEHSISPEAFSAFIQQLLNIHFIAVVE